MKASAILVLCASTSDAFITLAPVRTGKVTMSATQPSERRQFVESAVASVLGLTAFSQASYAAKYFGDKEDYPEVLKLENAVKDTEVFASSDTKNAVSIIKEYQKAAGELTAALEKDGQSDIYAAITKKFEFSKLRAALNTATVAFDEDSQRGLDRLNRLIIQDGVELSEASKLKSGVPRNQRRLTLMKTKLAKLNGAFTDLLKFF